MLVQLPAQIVAFSAQAGFQVGIAQPKHLLGMIQNAACRQVTADLG